MEDNDGDNGEGIKEGASIEEGKVKEARLEEGSVEVPEAKAMKTGATVEGPETTGKVFEEGAEVTVIEDALPEGSTCSCSLPCATEHILQAENAAS
jgi:hypothetical protein